MENIIIDQLDKKYFRSFISMMEIYQDKKYSDKEILKFEKNLLSWNDFLKVFILRILDKPVGFIFLVKSFSTSSIKNYYYLQDFYIDKDFRSNWLGTYFFQFIINYLKSNDINRLTWITSKDNLRAQKFYSNYKVDKNWLYYKLKI